MLDQNFITEKRARAHDAIRSFKTFLVRTKSLYFQFCNLTYSYEFCSFNY